jgi:thiol-disulfide isomerase/thioredoxin
MMRFTTGMLAIALLHSWGISRGDDRQITKPATRIIEGRVLDAGGAPVKGARVVLRADDDVMQPNGVIAETGADGRYSADVSRHGWAGSKLRCRALAPGFAYASRQVGAGSGRTTTDFTLKAEPWRSTEVRLADPAGRPGIGMAVSCLIDDLPWATLNTDDAGRCAVTMAIGQAFVLEAKPAASRPIRAVLLNTKVGPAQVVLPLLGSIVGRVHDAAGGPLAGVTVGRLISEGEQGLEVHPHFFSETVTTGADGKFAYAPTVMLRERDFEGRLDRKRLPGSICFADQSCMRVAFGLVDLAGPVEPLDIALEPGRPVRIPIEIDTVRPSADATGFLTVSLVPRLDLPGFELPVLSRDLTAGMLSGTGHVELRLPAGKYKFTVDCFTPAGKRLGEASGALMVAAGIDRLDLPALKVGSTAHQKLAGKPAPEIETTDLDTGKPIHLAEFRGKVVVLDFWGYWCGPCTGSMPHLVALHRKFAGRPVAVVALHDQSVQSRAEYDRRIAFARRAFWGGEDLPFRVLLDRPHPGKPADRDPEGTGVTCNRYGIVGFPTLFVIDQEGMIVAPVRHGDHEELERLVTRLLERPPAPADPTKK